MNCDNQPTALFVAQELAAEYTALSEQHIEKLLDDQRLIHDMQTQALWEVTPLHAHLSLAVHEHASCEIADGCCPCAHRRPGTWSKV